MATAMPKKSKISGRIILPAAAFNCLIRFPSLAPIAAERCDVKPFDVPTQQAMIRNSKGKARPIAAMEASPSPLRLSSLSNSAAKKVSTQAKAERSQKEMTSGPVSRRMEVGFT
jgi:hypothetical protein